MKILISLLLLLSLSSAFAQTETHVPKKDPAKQNIDFLLGFWIEDSAKYKIEFKIVQSELVLTQENYYTFNFLRTDSLPLTGVSISWPPHECQVKKLNENYIEILYTLFGRQKPDTVKYRRASSL